MISKHLKALLVAMIVTGCGTDPGGGDDVGGEDFCGFGTDRYLPFEPGLTWSYQVTNLESGERKTKPQTLAEMTDHPTFGRVIVQTTGKLAGSTRSFLRVEGDRVLRFQQDDLDTAGTVERTTSYDPGQIRIDESAAHVAAGARWEETYRETATEPGMAPVTLPTRDVWEVLGTGVACESPAGTFSCLHLRRTRAEGGVAVKEFFFARGVGKVRETGDNQVEALVSCGR